MVVRPVLCRRFIGRAEELDYLDEKRRAASRSRGALVLIAGEAGIGKSRLMAEFCTRLADLRWRVAYGSCLEHAQRPYGPILDVLSRIEPAEGRSLPAAANKGDQLDAIVDRFTQAAAKRGIVVVVEDAHWGDTATLELLAVLAPKLESMRMLVLVSYRPTEKAADDGWHAALARIERGARSGRIDLAPLAGRELENFIDEAVRDYRVPDDTRRAVAGTSDGNPFFAEELLKVAVERHSGAPGLAPESSELPLSVRSTLLERWHRLPESDRRVLSHAAVIGRSFELSLLVKTLQLDEGDVLSSLRRARDVQLIDADANAFRFRHALSRDAIYSAYLGAEVAPLHRRIALALETEANRDDTLEGLAYHWWAAHDAERSARYNELAGDAAASVHAHDDAIVFYRRALESPLLGPCEQGAIFEKLADRFYAVGAAERMHEAVGVAADRYRAASQFEEEARCRARVAIIAYTLQQKNPTSGLIAMLQRLDSGETFAKNRVHLGCAWVTASLGFPTESNRHLAQVDGAARAMRADVDLRFHNVSAWNAMTMGDLPTFRTEHAAWLRSAAGGPFGALSSAHMNGATCYAIFGEHEAAREQLEAAIELAVRERNRHAEQSAYAIAAGCYVWSGDLLRARDALAHVSPKAENRVTLSDAAAWGTLAGIHLGDERLRDTWYDAIGDDALDAVEEMCGAGFAEILVGRGRLEEARGVLHRSIPDCERIRANVFTFLAAARFAAPEDRERARAQLVTMSNTPTETAERHALALFDAYVIRREGPPHASIVLARAAAEGFGRLRFPLLQATALEVAGDLDEALAVYAACNAAGDLRRLAKRAPSEAALPRIRAATLVDRHGLSAREREIAALVATGSSNKIIAEQLNVSAKTVEKHLASVYRKLGITSRARLAVYASAEMDAVAGSAL